METQATKKFRLSLPENDTTDMFDGLPDDLVVSVLCKLSSSASSPADFISVLITCKRMNRLGLHPLVLSKARPQALVVAAKKWSDSAHRFLQLCVKAGNVDACYALGMIRFYCLKNRVSGASLMAKAAIKAHAPALYSLAVIQFTGSGTSKPDRNLRAGFALCARAASLGLVDALRELGHCLQDGYGVLRDASEGRRLLIQANAREFSSSLRAFRESMGRPPSQTRIHPVNRFLRDWFGSGSGRVVLPEGLRMCSHQGCGRPETRAHEFRRCSVCGKANYCSRGCQALDWRVRHRFECLPVDFWAPAVIDGGEAVAIDGGDAAAMENVARL